jgi:hypothetical protein
MTAAISGRFSLFLIMPTSQVVSNEERRAEADFTQRRKEKTQMAQRGLGFLAFFASLFAPFAVK